jgi:hypothetical protein
MNHCNKTALRAAILIHGQQTASGQPLDGIYLPDCIWATVHDLLRRITRAREHGWHAAAARLIKDLDYPLNDCQRYVDIAIQRLAEDGRPRKISAPGDIYRDILALYEEFEEVDIDLQKHELSVTTDRIVLEDYYLGHFQIRLNWLRLGHPQPYRVVALDPHPASKSEDITHPHVQDEQLCEGEGRAAIRAAQEECRLFDFFLLVSQVLHTYGRGSAFVELDHWTGVPCDDCGASLDDDDRYYCQHCEATLCSSCSYSCEHCGDSCCSDCISTCAACGVEYCSSCLETCSVCHKRFCEHCREEGGLCKSCHDKQRNEEKKDDPAQKEAQQRPANSTPARRRRRTAPAAA